MKSGRARTTLEPESVEKNFRSLETRSLDQVQSFVEKTREGGEGTLGKKYRDEVSRAMKGKKSGRGNPNQQKRGKVTGSVGLFLAV